MEKFLNIYKAWSLTFVFDSFQHGNLFYDSLQDATSLSQKRKPRSRIVCGDFNVDQLVRLPSEPFENQRSPNDEEHAKRCALDIIAEKFNAEIILPEIGDSVLGHPQSENALLAPFSLQNFSFRL